MTGLRAAVRWLQEASLYLLILLLPFSKASIELTFAGLFFGWLFARLDPATRRDSLWHRPALRTLLAVLTGYLAVCALSIAVSRYPGTSLKGFVGKWLQYLLFTVVIADVALHPAVVKRSLRVFAAAALFVVFEAVTQERYGNGFFRNFRLDFYFRMTGPYENPIDLATYLMVVIPILLAVVLTRAWRARWPLLALLAALVVCLVRTESLGAWLGLGIGLLMMSVMSRAVRRYGVLLLVAASLIGAGSLIRRHRLAKVASWSEIGKTDRIAVWTSALRMIQDRPILGHGVNTFMANYLSYWVGGEQQPRYAHNCYLQVAAETGLIGLALFAWLLGLLFYHLYAACHRLGSKERLILLGLFGGLLAFAAQAALDTNFYAMRQAALFWMVAGLALGISQWKPNSSLSANR